MKESDLIFLISAPRSGSSLLQHILGSHSLIHTQPEPWFLLGLAYHRVPHGVTEYNSHFSGLAVNELLQKSPAAESAYRQGIQDLVLNTYQALIPGNDKKYFLDKTTRYYLILPTLFSLFPNARYVFLLRNPIAILSSILKTNFGGDLTGFNQQDRQNDIYKAPGMIRDAINSPPKHHAVIHYENLAREPEDNIRLVCDALDVTYEPEMIQYGDKVNFKDTSWVDPKSIYQHKAPVAKYVDSWRESLASKEHVAFCRQYLDQVDESCLHGPGYSPDSIRATLDDLDSELPNVTNRRPLSRRWQNLRHKLGLLVSGKPR